MSDDRLRQSYDMLLALRVEAAAERTTCPPVERLAGLIGREEDEDARLALLDHVMACPYCMPEFELLRSASRASGGHVPPPGS